MRAQTKNYSEDEMAELLTKIVEDIKPIVAKIEKLPPTTRNHYGDYMAVLSQTEEPRIRKRLAAILVIAGANEQGVADALKLCS